MTIIFVFSSQPIFREELVWKIKTFSENSVKKQNTEVAHDQNWYTYKIDRKSIAFALTTIRPTHVQNYVHVFSFVFEI